MLLKSFFFSIWSIIFYIICDGIVSLSVVWHLNAVAHHSPWPNQPNIYMYGFSMAIFDFVWSLYQYDFSMACLLLFIQSHRIHLAIDINWYKLHWPMAHLFCHPSPLLPIPVPPKLFAIAAATAITKKKKQTQNEIS